VIATVKMNLAIEPVPLAFKLLPAEGMDVARVDWRGAVEGMTAEILLGDHGSTESAEDKADKQSKLDLAVEAITEVLKDGPAWSQDLLDAVVNKGRLVSNSTFDRARAKLDLATTRERLPDGTMGWRVRLRTEEGD
jgi:hypothetical protein